MRIPHLLTVVAGLLTLLLLGCGEPPVAVDPWRSSDQALADRIEQLTGAGEVDAAQGVFHALTARPGLIGTPAEQRARLAMARALVATGRHDEALIHVRSISWADKGPHIAAQVLSLESRLRWQQLTSDGRILTGALPPRAAADAPQGEPGGLWLERREAYRAFAEILDRGQRSVRAEGQELVLPVAASEIAVARFAFGDVTQAQLFAGLGEPATWSPALALALLRVQVAEHEIEDGTAVAQLLWDRHPAEAEAATAFHLLRVWQLSRERAADGLRLWRFPALESRLTELVASYPEAERLARAELAEQHDVNAQAVVRELTRAKAATEVQVAQTAADVIDESTSEGPSTSSQRTFKLAKSWSGLVVTPGAPIVAAGTVASVGLDSEYRGEHRLAVWQLPDAAAYATLAADPQRARLPAVPLLECLVTVAPWSTLGEQRHATCELGELPEGFYAVTVTARACPVVVMAGFTVADVDLHAWAGEDAVMAWVVRRRDGCGKAGEPLQLTATLVRDPARAAGAAWSAGDDAWRAGFRAAFLGIDDHAWKGSEDGASFAAGRQAGSAAALSDRAREVVLSATSDDQGLVRWPIPAEFFGRSWKAQVAVARSAVAVAAQLEQPAVAGWNAVHLAWADKAVVRPGETLRYKALLRDWDGERWRRPVGVAQVRIQCAGVQLFAGEVAVNDVGTVAGEVVVPPGCTTGIIELAVMTGTTSSPGQRLAQVLDLRLPPGSFTLIDDVESDVRAGETRGLRAKLCDAAGTPMVGTDVRIEIQATDIATGVAFPGEGVRLTTDATGEILARIPSARDAECAVRAILTAEISGQRFSISTSWTTRRFPVPLAVELAQRSYTVGDVLRARIRLPASAEITLGLVNSGNPVGAFVPVHGTGTWQEITLPLTVVHQGATALQMRAVALGGGVITRELPLQIGATSTTSAQAVRCEPGVRSVLPGATLAVTLGVMQPGRDVLLVGGSRSLVLAHSEHLDDPARTVSLTVTAAWAPNLVFQAITWLPNRGFTVSTRQPVTVLPVDRLLSVAVTPDRPEYRIADQALLALTVTDWKQRPVAGASLSLAVVDERFFALGEDLTPDLQRYFTSQQRTWSVAEASADGIRAPQAHLWRAIARRWQGEAGSFGNRFGSGKKSAIGRAGGSRGSEPTIPILPEVDATIAWSADVRTDAEGRAVVPLTLPARAGRYRVTARANDANAAVMVGEVRGEVVISEPLSCGIQAPIQVVEGDCVAITCEIASRLVQELPVTVTIRRQGSLSALAVTTAVIPAGGRRQVALPVTFSEPATGPIIRVGNLLGQAVRLDIEVTSAGERPILAHHEVLMAAPGVPTVYTKRLVADAEGRVNEVLAPAGATAWVRVRAWPDAAARRQAELQAWRNLPGARGALAWLLADDGPERRDALAQRWPTLGMTPADVYVRLVSRRLAGTGTVDVGAPDASVTGWLAACARSQGLAIRLPILPTADSLATATLTAAVALREATPGAGRQWLEVRSQLGEASPELALVLGLDAALTAGDLPTVARLQAELAGRDWSDELVAVVAADLLPVTGSNQPAAVMLHPGGGPVPLTTATWTTWSGRLIEDLRVTATPGSLIALEIVAQSERVAVEPTGPIPRILRLQSGAESMRMNDGTILAGRRFVPLAPGTAVEVGETLALDYPHDGPWVLPALVRLAPSGAQVLCQDRVEETWSLPENSSTNGPRRRIAEMYVTQIPIVLQRLAIGADAVSALSGRRVVDARLVLVEVCAQGVCALGAGRLLEARAHVERDEPEPVFPLMSALQALYDRVGDEDREFLLLSPTATVEDWRRRMAVVDPQQEASLTLAEIVSHPACGRRGHHLTQALRRWIDGEPAFDALTAEGGSLAVSSLGDVMQIVSASRAERELAIAHLPFPHPAETSRPHAIRAWVERCLAVQALQIPVGVSVVDWLWSQPVSREEYRRFGYRATVDEWRRFLVEEFGFQVRIGRGIPAGDERAEDVSDPLFTPDGGRLGFERLAAAGLELVQMGDALEIRSRAEAPVLVSLFTHDALLSQAVAQLNRQLTARGLREIRYDAIGDEPRVTLQLDGLLPRLAIEQLARQTGSQVTAWRGTVRLLSQQMAETPSSVP